ncbi:Zinc finger, RING-type [Corchorus olitorius]|uniref:RING-type E3 ubiquitin transferase n=1 Tax=Corchorus olitorius TaxID=93759 RepID=A0A1R3GP14_9ROSI|nr:Zinc finger, RING-type [Corchorus olitorius]
MISRDFVKKISVLSCNCNSIFMVVMEIVFSVVLLFVGIAVLVVIHVCIVGRAFRRGYEVDGSLVQISSNNNNGIKRMSDEEVKKLPSFDYKAAEKGSSPIDCVVCLENFRKGDKCKLLPNCRHSFHSQCIDSWLLKTPICPICRTCAHPSKVGMNNSKEESGVSTIHEDGLELV